MAYMYIKHGVIPVFGQREGRAAEGIHTYIHVVKYNLLFLLLLLLLRPPLWHTQLSIRWASSNCLRLLRPSNGPPVL
jgi:hypothetical protein